MKKILSMALASSMVLGMSAVAFGAVTWDRNTKISLGYSYNGTNSPINYTFTSDVHPEDTLEYIYIFDENGNQVDKATVKNEKLDIQTRVSEGSSVIKKAEIKYDKNGHAYVKLSFVDEWVSTKDQDFSVDLYVTVNKTRNTASLYTVTGTFNNISTDVYEGDDYVYTVDAPVVNAEDYVKSIQVDMGQNVSIYTKMFDGKKYYAAVSQDVKAEDDAVLAKYPAIDTVYYLKTINLSGSGNIVKFDLETNMYAYAQDENGNLVFVGRTADKLPYYTKYFLSAKELDVAAADDNDSVPSDNDNGVAPTAPTGGDDAPIDNVNENPGTGR